MTQDVVDFFKQSGGYGFIETDEPTRTFSSTRRTSAVPTWRRHEVEFEIEQAEKGPRAKNLPAVDARYRRSRRLPGSFDVTSGDTGV